MGPILIGRILIGQYPTQFLVPRFQAMLAGAMLAGAMVAGGTVKIVMLGQRTMLEVCVDTVQAATAAVQAGADRIELCTALDVGGVTPPNSLVDSVRRRVACPLVVLVRPRTGNFIYDAADCQQMLAAIEHLLPTSMEGVVVGGLTEDGQLDIPLLRAVRELVPPTLDLVMHRAFDFVHDQSAALEQLIELRFTRVLTAGGATGNALDNLEQLRNLNQLAAGRITILPGGGVTQASASTIIRTTGCRQLHGSFRAAAPASARPTSAAAAFGTSQAIDSVGVKQVSQWLQASAELG